MYAALSLDHELLKEVLEKTLEPEVKEDMVTKMLTGHEQVSIIRAVSCSSINHDTIVSAARKEAIRK